MRLFLNIYVLQLTFLSVFETIGAVWAVSGFLLGCVVLVVSTGKCFLCVFCSLADGSVRNEFKCDSMSHLSPNFTFTMCQEAACFTLSSLWSPECTNVISVTVNTPFILLGKQKCYHCNFYVSLISLFFVSDKAVSVTLGIF